MKFKALIIFIVVYAMSIVGQGQSVSSDSLQLNVTDSVQLFQQKKQLLNLENKLSLDSLALDSLSISSLDSVKSKIDSVESMSMGKLDSIKGKIDSVDDWVNDLTTLPEQKLNATQDKITNTIDSGIEKVENATIGKVTGKFDTPELGVEDQLPPVENQLPSMEGSNIPNTELEGIHNAPELNLPAIQDPLEVDGIMESVEEIKNKPSEQLDKIKEVEEVKKVTEQVSQVKEVSGKAQEYKEGVKAVKEGDYTKIEETAENELKEQTANIDEVGEMTKHNEEIEQLKQQQLEYQQQLEEYKDQKAVKNQLKQRASERGAEFFAQHSEKLNEARNGYGSYKKKFLKVKGETKVLKLKPNAMKGKPFLERFIVGGYTQVIKLQSNAVDLSPLMAYKLSGLFVFGVGGTYRLDLGMDGKSPTNSNPVYGFRNYLDIKGLKGFYLHGEYESLRTNVPVQNATTTDIINRQWVNSIMAGIGKKYKIKGRINGYIQALNNFSYEFNRSPYSKKLMIRVGIEGIFASKKRE